jgi:hypothetical protein
VLALHSLGQQRQDGHEIVINIMDEIDGSQADETVRFGLDGEAFELRSKAHAEELCRSLEPYVKTARKTGSERNSRRFDSAAIDRDQARAIRDRAKQHGMKVSDSGRV